MHARARWAVPAVVAAVVVGGAAVAPSVASAAPDLAPTTAAELLADVAAAPAHALSGTVELTTDLGLPELPSAGAGGATGSTGGGGDGGGGGGPLDLAALTSGTTTARVWTDGGERSRVSVVDGLSESTVVRSGHDVWTWSSGASSQRGTTHAVLPDEPPAAGTPAQGSPALPDDLTPQESAERVLAAVDDDTAVVLDGTASVAGRDAYLLALEPRTPDTLVGRVVLAVDAQTSTPLRVQVFARGAQVPAVSVGFRDVHFGQPADDDVTPAVPGDAPVRELEAPAVVGGGATDRSAAAGAQVLGSGWTAVAVLPGAGAGALPEALTSATTQVSGAFGRGRVLSTPLLTVLLTDDGRVLAGAVPASALEAAAAQR